MRSPAAHSDAPLADVMEKATFTIPMRIDSPDRLRNLLDIVRHLHRTYPSRITVGSDEPGGLVHLLPPGVEVLTVDSTVELPFHHTRVLNDLYHLAHYRGPDSGDANPHFDANMDELRRISEMSADALRAEIDSWPWLHR